MKEIETEILIIGSGLVGLVVAHSLSSLNYKLTIVDRKKTIDTKKYFSDTRTTAVSEGSKIFLEKLSLWSFLEPYCEPIKQIKVYDRSSKNKILFNNYKEDSNLGYVIENKIFSKILLDKLKNKKNTNVLFDQDVKKIQLDENNAKAYLQKYKITSKLIVSADGKNSNVKKMVGNKTYKKIYSENALVLNFSHETSLNNIAYEAFLNTGPLAILPMKSFKQYFKSTLIWSNKPEFLKKLNDLDNRFIANFIEEKIGSIVGKIIKVNTKQIFPLSAHINESFINKRLVYVGDSAHSIHPIAGQGWNLGVSDVKNLHEICIKSKEAIGSDLFCKKYNYLSYNKAFQLYQITDKLNSHFKINNRLYRKLSNIGFSFIDNTDLIRNKIAKYAMGI
tara:strand:+ start:1944 stop:3116 length:1173 start_codon:yes stop_codon:yes gene_type:complete